MKSEMKNSKVKLNRRHFLLAAGAGSAGAAAPVVAGKGAPTATSATIADTPKQPEVKGYHFSAHIEKYYKSTLI